jgi:hypothetical protein
VVDDELDALREEPVGQRVSGVLDAEVAISDASGACPQFRVQE